ncbi:MAG TPA: hypothetical protein VG603_04785 [Chitinophagales bacterium]|nr:hypothetical protein [Chitinophagales bacterium]
MAKKRQKKKTKEDIGTENELMKLKMMAEFGGNFMGSEDIPPEVENQFLKQIINFHKLHENASTTSVYKFIGEPEYNHVNDLSDREVKPELKRLMKLMAKNGVSLSVLADTPEREIYRFVTEELFKHEIENVKMKGWTNQFIYEEFHPNAKYDVQNAVRTALQFIFTKKGNFFDEYFSEEMKDALGLSLDLEDFKGRVDVFQSSFNDIQFVEVEFDRTDIDKENGYAHAACTVTYKIQKQKGRRFKNESIEVEFNLQRSSYMESWWEIYQVITDLF